MTREGIECGFHTEAVLYEAQAYLCGRALKKCTKKTFPQGLQDVKYTSCLDDSPVLQKYVCCDAAVVGKPAKVLLLCRSFSQVPVPSKQIVNKQSLFVARNAVTSRRQDLLLTSIST
jgi:hypothetical protein